MNITSAEFKKLMRSRKTKIKVYQNDNGYWRVCWFGGDGLYTSVGFGRGYQSWEDALSTAIGSLGKDPFTYAVLTGMARSLENERV